MTAAFTSITTAVGEVITMATTGELAIYFYGGIAVLAIGIFAKLKKK